MYAISPEGARSVLSTIAGSMMTVAGVIFSITIVALNLASSQFGPRLLRNFMQDRGTQYVLGTFVSSFIYCLLVLRSAYTAGNESFVPSFSVNFAVVLAFFNVGVLIYFIHHIANSIQADEVIELDDTCMRRLAAPFIIGEQRTSQQDAEYSIHQLVEVAIRALSPGINDPYTAIRSVGLCPVFSYHQRVAGRKLLQWRGETASGRKTIHLCRNGECFFCAHIDSRNMLVPAGKSCRNAMIKKMCCSDTNCCWRRSIILTTRKAPMKFPLACRRLPGICKLFLGVGIIFLVICPAIAQDEKSGNDAAVSPDEKKQVAEQIKVRPIANDQAINQRLSKILKATGWFTDIAVKVEEGVVFLDGRTDSKDNRLWAGALAGKVTDVVAVVNRINVVEPSPWNMYPAINEVSLLWETLLQGLPRFGLGLIVLIVVFMVARLTVYGFRRVLDKRLNPLLADVAARVISILVFLLGFYLALQVAGLSGLSTTVLGGTGIAGLVAGIAFRDLLENYLASILISIRNPFRIGDLVEISDNIGVVERVTTRGTVLMNPDGNHVQIPNAIVYKSIIRNYTANPNRREMFEVGIGFESNASHAQEVAMKVLNEHPAVLGEPEALVLVNRLGSATVNLVIYFWYDGSAYDGMKVKSSLIRLVKQAFEREQISMPDEAREIIFPSGVPVHISQSSAAGAEAEPVQKTPPPRTDNEQVTTEAEGSLESEELQLRDQARMSRTPEQGESLLQEEPGR